MGKLQLECRGRACGNILLAWLQPGVGFSIGNEKEIIMKKINLSKAVMMGCVILIGTNCVFAQNWPGWRGDGRGISPEKDLPLRWSEDEGVKWKTPIPGAGHSSPIVWGNRVFVTTAVAEDPNVESFRGGVYMGGNRSKPDESEYAHCVGKCSLVEGCCEATPEDTPPHEEHLCLRNTRHGRQLRLCLIRLSGPVRR